MKQNSTYSSKSQPAFRVRFHTRGVRILIDAVLICASFILAYILGFAGLPPFSDIKDLIFLMPYLLLLRLFFNYLFGIYNSIWRYTSVDEAVTILKSTFAASVIILLLRILIPEAILLHYIRLPYSVIINEFIVTSGFLVGIRLLRRVLYESDESRKHGINSVAQNVLLIGAGQAGLQVAKEAKQRPDLGMRVRGFIDDDKSKVHTSIASIKVLGATEDLPVLVHDLEIEQVIITITNASGKDIRRIVDICEKIPVQVKIIPSLFEILDGRVSMNKIRDVEINDLLGRDVVELDHDAAKVMERYMGKRILVTGAGGSIGSELCRQLLLENPSKLIMLDKDENSIFEISLELAGKAEQIKKYSVIADIRNTVRLRHVFDTYRPEVIFHAAAHKHVPLMEINPSEAILNNVIGTRNLLQLADEYGVETFLMISTDKAVNPTNIMGCTKRICELMVQDVSKRSHTRFSCVRFGNVLGSRGSVVQVFKKQIAAGGPITITHPDITRYFMTIPEAVQLIIKAGSLGENGEIFVLDMGKPVKIVDLARDLIRLSGLKENEDIEIKFIGLRPGEKLFEELLIKEEEAKVTNFKKIFVANPMDFDAAKLTAQIELLHKAALEHNDALIIKNLQELGIGWRATGLESPVYENPERQPAGS